MQLFLNTLKFCCLLMAFTLLGQSSAYAQAMCNIAGSSSVVIGITYTYVIAPSNPSFTPDSLESANIVGFWGSNTGYTITPDPLDPATLSVTASSGAISGILEVVLISVDANGSVNRDLCEIPITIIPCDNLYTIEGCTDITGIAEGDPVIFDAPTVTTCCSDVSVTKIDGPNSGDVLVAGTYLVNYEIVVCDTTESCRRSITVDPSTTSVCEIDPTITTTDISCTAEYTQHCNVLSTAEHALWLPDLPYNCTPHFFWDANGGDIIFYADGTAHITGTVVNEFEPNCSFNVDIWLTTKMDFDTWEATYGGGVKHRDDKCVITTEYFDWDYFLVDGTRSTLTGNGWFAGETLNLTHMPADYTYAVQVGDGANVKNCNYGLASWFYYSGSFSGNGDINVDLDCGPKEYACEGDATVTLPGGTSGYDIAWSDGQTGDIARDLCEGCYDVIITEQNNISCADTIQVCIDNENNYDADGDGVPDVCDTCADTPTGVTVDATGCEIPCVVIDEQDFEGGWGIWLDGGYDCKRYYDSYYANSGNYSIRLRDNSGNSSSTRTANLDLSMYSSVEVCFSYITNSMDNSYEDFWLQVSTNGGNSYTIVEEWNLNDEFVNHQRYDVCVNITTISFTNQTRLKFTCDASADGDQVYIDDITITGCATDSTPDTPTTQSTCDNPTNLALNGTASQSSNYYSDYAHYAIDGNTSGNYWEGLATTDYQCNANWELDLGCIADIDHINIYNRNDWAGDYTSDFYVLVSDLPFQGNLSALLSDPNVWSYHHAAVAGMPSTISVGRTGRYICIMLNGCAWLTMSEVEVMGCCTTNKTSESVLGLKSNIIAGKVESDKDFNARLHINNLTPNPATDMVNLQYMAAANRNATISIFNITGQRVLNQTVANQEGINKVSIPVSDLPSGTYMLQIKSEEHTSTQKFIVK